MDPLPSPPLPSPPRPSPPLPSAPRSPSLLPTGGWAKARCLLNNAEESLSFSLQPPTRRLLDAPTPNMGAPWYQSVGLSTGARAKAWCLLIHAEASLSISPYNGGPGEGLVPPGRREATLSLTFSVPHFSVPHFSMPHFSVPHFSARWGGITTSTNAQPNLLSFSIGCANT